MLVSSSQLTKTKTHNQENLAIQACNHLISVFLQPDRCLRLTDNPAVVAQVPVQNGQANIEKDAMGALVQKETVEHLQTVGVDIELMEVIETGISANLKLLNDCM